MAELMTQAAYARHRGVERQTVQRWKDRGELVIKKNDKNRDRVDVAESDALLDAMQNPLKVKNGSKPSTADSGVDGPDDGRPAAVGSAESAPPVSEADSAPSPQPPADPLAARIKSARAQKEMAEAASANIKYQSLAGSLVPRVEVHGIGAAACAMLQQALTRSRVDFARKLQTCQSHREILAAIRERDYKALSAFADGCVKIDEMAVAPGHSADAA